MAKLTGNKLTLEAFKNAPEWMGSFLSSLNGFIQETTEAFNNNLTIADNLSQEIKELKFVNSSGNFPLVFKTKFAKNPKGLYVMYCLNQTDSTMAASVVWPTWSYSNSQISISALTNLTADKTYIIRFHVIYE